MMKAGLLAIFLFLGIGGFQKIAEMNARTQEAELAFREKRYAQAVKNYEYLVYEAKDQNLRLQLNLAHAYRLNNQADKAAKTYKNCLKSSDPTLRSVAWEQLGTLETKIQNYTQALTYYKRALIANPKNEQARYNYELLKKFLRENPEKQNQVPPPAQQEKQDQPQPKPQENQEPQNQQEQPNPEGNQEKENPNQQEKGDQQQKPDQEKDPQNPDKQDHQQPNDKGRENPQPQGSEKGNQQGQNLAENEDKPGTPQPNKKGGSENASGNEQQLQTQYERLRKANISPEKAEMMLNAMRAAEQQYLQQLPKKGTKKKDPTKPDW